MRVSMLPFLRAQRQNVRHFASDMQRLVGINPDLPLTLRAVDEEMRHRLNDAEARGTRHLCDCGAVDERVRWKRDRPQRTAKLAVVILGLREKVALKGEICERVRGEEIEERGHQCGVSDSHFPK